MLLSFSNGRKVLKKENIINDITIYVNVVRILMYLVKKNYRWLGIIEKCLVFDAHKN